MSSPYIGEIRMFGGNFAPVGWAFCQGQTLPISENDTLFNLIGTTYGGDGQETFNLPNLASRVPIHTNGTYQIGSAAGVEQVTLTQNTTPAHTHTMLATANPGNVASPAGNVLAEPTAAASVANPATYGTDTPLVALAPASILPQGGNQPHDNMQPYLCVNFIISLFGIYPTQN